MFHHSAEVPAVPLRYLFVDLNAFFASVEQQDDPRLRGQPIAVIAVWARTTCCLAVSYEARAYGIKTGTPVWAAMELCPGIRFRLARTERYVEVHHQIVKAVGRCLPIHRVMSIDEMACKLLGAERQPAAATAIGLRIKQEIRALAGDTLRCSVGVGPNVLLAKVAGDMKKPDGLTLIGDGDLPGRLYGLKLDDFPGIGPRMEARLHRAGVFNVRQLVAMTATQLAAVWGSRVHGERWFFALRGEDISEAPTHRRTVGHSHVLPPELRTDDGAYGVIVRLIHKAAARLRSIDYWAGALDIGARFGDGRWDAGCKLASCQDTLTLLRATSALWARRPDRAGAPRQVWVTLRDLEPARAATPSLFEEDRRLTAVSRVMDAVNRRFGKNALRYGSVIGSERTAPSRIAFGQVPKADPAFG